MSTDDGQEWAKIIRSAAENRQVEKVITAVNIITERRGANRAAVIVACAQILAQSITGGAEDEISHEMRQGIMALIDGFAMRLAVQP